jgi:hypothetical protein
MTKKLTIQRLSDELETIVGPELYALKGGYYGGYSDGSDDGIPRPTGGMFNYNYYGYDLLLYEYTYTGFDGSQITLHKAQPHVSSEVRSNCLGYALTGGEYMIIDQNIDRSNLGSIFGYVACSKSEASLVVIYNGSTISHAGTYNSSTDTYGAKGGGADHYTQTGMSLQQFYQPYVDDGDNVNYEPQNPNDIVYYKKVGIGGIGGY